MQGLLSFVKGAWVGAAVGSACAAGAEVGTAVAVGSTLSNRTPQDASKSEIMRKAGSIFLYIFKYLSWSYL
jgi:hypothetical protein